MRPEQLDFLLRVLPISLAKVYGALGCTQVRVIHQLRHDEYANAGFDGTYDTGAPRVIKAKRRFDSALTQGPEARRL